MLVRITKEAYKAWCMVSETDVPCRELTPDMVEIDLPDDAYDQIVSGRLQGETLSCLILRKVKQSAACPCP